MIHQMRGHVAEEHHPRTQPALPHQKGPQVHRHRPGGEWKSHRWSHNG
jgi:hypothetical protein